jgi:hypothetical protein
VSSVLISDFACSNVLTSNIFSAGAVEKVDTLFFYPLCYFYVENQIKELEFFIFPSFYLLDAVLLINQGSVKAAAKQVHYSLDGFLICRFFASGEKKISLFLQPYISIL